MLRQMTSQQEHMEQRQKEFDKKMLAFRGKLSKMTEPSSSSSCDKAKSRNPRDLTVRMII